MIANFRQVLGETSTTESSTTTTRTAADAFGDFVDAINAINGTIPSDRAKTIERLMNDLCSYSTTTSIGTISINPYLWYYGYYFRNSEDQNINQIPQNQYLPKKTYFNQIPKRFSRTGKRGRQQ